MMRLPAAGNRLPDAICRFSSAGCHLSAVVYRLSAVRCVCLGVAMRFCPGSRINRLMLIPGQKSLSRFEKTGVFRVPGQFSLPRYERQSFYVRTGTTCRSRDWRYSADSACRGMWTLKIGLSRFSKMGRNCVPGQIRAQRRGRGAPQWRWASLWLEANSRPGTIGRGRSQE